MGEQACVQRLQKEFKALCKEPPPHILARPCSNDILEWHYVLEGSKGTPFEGGVYHGKVKFPSDYPFKPPSITMITPNGRFATQKRLCMSMSDCKYGVLHLLLGISNGCNSTLRNSDHPETWNPMWSVSSILTGLLSFMMDNSPTTGSLSTTAEEKRRLAQASLSFNCKSAVFRKMFPEYVQKLNELQKAELVVGGESGDAATPTTESSHVEVQLKGKPKQKPSQKFPGWLTAALFAILLSIMALPLLTLDLKTV